MVGPSLSGSGQRRAFAYDHAGERVASFEFDGGSLESVRYTIRDEQGNVLSDILRVGDVFTREADRVYKGRDEQVRMVHGAGGAVRDPFGSLKADMEESGGGRVRLEPWPYGEDVPGSTDDGLRIRFTGHERDLNLPTKTTDDLDSMHARYHSFWNGRFLSVGPVDGVVGLSQSWHRYMYVRGNPVGAVDPDGRLDNGLLVEAEADRLLVKELGPQSAQKVFAARQEARARIGGVVVSMGLAALTGGESLLWNAIAGGLSNVAGGLYTRAADGNQSTKGLDGKSVVVDLTVGVVATRGANKVVSKIESRLAAAGGAGTANAVEQAVSASLSVAGGAGEEWMEKQMSAGPNPKASAPSVNCHRQPICEHQSAPTVRDNDDWFVPSHDRNR